MSVHIFTQEDIDEFRRPATRVARWLLNKLVIFDGVVLRIVETEAYGYLNDRASHAYVGKKRFNATMFAPKGYLYVYKIYGIHHCMNIVCGSGEEPAAVLLRAAEVKSGVAAIEERRGKRDLGSIASGPANLCASLGIDKDFDGLNLLGVSPVKIGFDGVLPPENCLEGKRIGLGKRAGEAALYDWRYAVPDSSALSRKFPVSLRGNATADSGITAESG